MKKAGKVPVSERALVQRINRVLIKEGEQLKKARSVNTSVAVGDYFIIDVQRNFVAYQHIDVEELGQKLGVLKNYEQLQS